jgi:hypothetical protein
VKCINYVPHPPPQNRKNRSLCRILNNDVDVKDKIGKYPLNLKLKKHMRQGDAIAPMLLNVVLKIAISRSTVETGGNIFDKCNQIMANAYNRWKELFYLEGSKLLSEK